MKNKQDPYQLILANIARIVKLSDSEKKLFTSKLKIGIYKPKTLLVEKGKVNTNTYFVNEGCVRTYALNNDGVEYSLYFAPKDWWVSDMYSYISGNPAENFVEVVLPAEVVSISKKDIEEMLLKIPCLERFFRILIERSVVAHQQRISDNISKTAEERYVSFQKKYPALVNSVPQKQIASYIGVTPEFFSKMKARMLKSR